MTVIAFEARLEIAARGGAVVTIPPDVYDALGGSGRIPVAATFDGVGYRGSVVRMDGRPILGVLKAIRQELSIGEGDVISVTIQRDDAERAVGVPSDLAAADVQCGWRYPNVVRVAPVPLYNSFVDIHRFVSILEHILD